MPPANPSRRTRVGAVSFLNTKPLIHGLADHADVVLDVPSRLHALLHAGEVDVALIPVADVPGILALGGTMLPEAGGIACDGETLTVRIFSRLPLSRIRTLECDTDSHTSVALARYLLAARHDNRPDFVPLSGTASPSPETARLLIGDKVITSPPDSAQLPLRHDLGTEWKLLTGLPFVFAVWTARPGFDAASISSILATCRDRGVAEVETILQTHAPRLGWPTDLARAYLTRHLHYHLTPRDLSAIRLFWTQALGVQPG
jgi:chorismate dehydratase